MRATARRCALVGATRRVDAPLLAFARRQPLDPRVTDVNALVRGMTGLVRRTLDSRIEMRESPAGPVADPRSRSLEAALMNLIVNSRDAMPDGGLLSVETRNAVIADEADQLSQDGAGKYCRRWRIRRRGGSRYGNGRAGKPDRSHFRTVSYYQGAGQRLGTRAQHGVWLR